MPAMFNQILILDSIPVGEYNTARRLYDDVAVLATALGEDAPTVVPLRVDSAAHFAYVMQECAQLATRDPYVPLVHLECHGAPEGVQFADGSQATWSEMKAMLTPLNIATRLNLIVVMSACHGSALARAIEITDAAPVWGFVGPNRVMRAWELERGFVAFYRTLLSTHSSVEAARALRATAEAGTFMVMSSERMFELASRSYQDRQCQADAIRDRAYALQLAAQARGVHVAIEEIERKLADPGWIERFHRVFFMVEQYPQNAERFPMPAPAA